MKTMFQSKNNAQVSFLKKELDNIRMLEGDNMVDHLMKVQDLREQLLNIDEVISDEKMISKTLHSLLPSY